jgi:hypothetical protein
MQDGLDSRGYAAGVTRAAGFWRVLPWLMLGALLAWLCAWRVSCIAAGPDPDTDAYGHYVIARLLPDTPLNFRMHWVWLPLYHALLALPIALGATLDDVRTANALAAALPALILFGALRKPACERRSLLDDGAPLLAASLTALSPLFMQLGTTGQMEVFFCVLLVLAVALLSRGRHGWAALVLSALVLTRYEGWAVACVVAAVFLSRRFTRDEALDFTAPGRARLACVLLPTLCVLGWAALRRLGGEPWFGFLFENQAFAEQVLERHPDSHGALGGLGRYTLSVPFRSFGLALPLALLGLVPTWRYGAVRHAGIGPNARASEPGGGMWLVLPGLGIVGFLTLSSLSRSQLGLDRHFVSAVPFVATWIAFGAVRAAELLSGCVNERKSALAPALFVALALVIVASSVVRLDTARASWWTATTEALREPLGVAAFLRETPATSLIVCDNASVEVLSGLDRARFVRTHLDAGTVARVEEWSRSRDVYIVNRARHLRVFLHTGVASYGTLDGNPDALAVVTRPASGR